MKVPPVGEPYYFGIRKLNKISSRPKFNSSADSVSFSASTAKYLKKYRTLPEEIKKILSPKDAIDMFKDMELVAQGAVKRQKIGQGNSSKVYLNPWLEDYYLIVLKNTQAPTQVVYSQTALGDAIWRDNENSRIQIIRKAKM